MSQRPFISRFTPSCTDPALLEAITVQRQELLRDAVERVAESARTADKHHLLFVGPRGSGKSHLVALLVHRVDAIAELESGLRIAWLDEDETCTSVLELLARIITALGKRYPGEFEGALPDDAAGLDESGAVARLTETLMQRLAGRRVLVIVEDMDDLFEAFGEAGQHALRALLQNRPVFCLVGTALALFDGVRQRTAPFFGFFQTEHFDALSVDQAGDLLANIARARGDDGLEKRLGKERGRARLRALHHLAGGNHRVYVALSEFLTRDALDDLVGPVEELLDGLTPYYEARLRWLAPLQRRIVEHLCKRRQPTAVKDIAARLFSSHQTIASQLKLLRELGFVESSPRGRESLYEISDPLLRLCVSSRESDGGVALRGTVTFLRSWYAPPEENAAAVELVQAILRSGLGRASWAGPIQKAIDRAARQETLATLGCGLVRGLTALQGAGLDGAGLDAWRNAWQEAGARHETLAVPLRIFAIGIEYVKTGDPGALLGLLKEERAIALAALQIS